MALTQPTGWSLTKGNMIAESSNPGIAFAGIPIEASGVEVNRTTLATWHIQSFMRNYAEQFGDNPMSFFWSATGGDYTVKKIVVESESERPVVLPSHEATQPVPELIAKIRSSLSLQIKELAEILHVERPTVYAWIKNLSTPQRSNYQRLRQLDRLTVRWNRISRNPIGKAIRELDENGKSIVDYLKKQLIPVETVIEHFRRIALGSDTSEHMRKLTVCELAKKHSINLEHIHENEVEFDLLTGKRLNLE